MSAKGTHHDTLLVIALGLIIVGVHALLSPHVHIVDWVFGVTLGFLVGIWVSR